MGQVIAPLPITGAALVVAAAVIVAVVSRRPLTRVAERRCGARVLRATPVHQRHAERPSAAVSARQIHVITDAKEVTRHGP